MGKLRAEPGAAVASAEGDDAGERRLILVRIEAEVVMRDAPARLDGRRPGDQQARSRERELAEMGEVPVRGATILGAVFAHRREDDAVGQEIGRASCRERVCQYV